jgi:hypothetical protein
MNLHHLLWYLYGIGWAAFAVWWMYLPHPPNSRFRPKMSSWSTGAKVGWGILFSISVVKLVYSIHSVWSR